MAQITTITKPMIFIIALITLLLTTTTLIIAAPATLTDRPVIGILAQPVSMEGLPAAYPNRQYIASSYIKFVEQSGGRVVPISWTSTREEINSLLPQINGVLLTGGDSSYGDVVDYIYDAAIKMNNDGVHFPVWATCQGFQFTGIYFAQDRNLLGNYEVYNKALPLDIVTNSATKTDFWNNMSADMKKLISTTAITMNFHHYGIGMADFNTKLSKDFNLISTNKDINGVEHVSTMEHNRYPFFAVQWHPEKNNDEFPVDSEGNSRHTTPHTFESILMTQYCSNLFIQQCRLNGNGFGNWKELQAKLIYNFSPMRGDPSAFVQNYFFDHWY